MVKYIYDAWGNNIAIDANGEEVESGIGVLNPFRYRGYYYDTETELYYLQTRYYDPEIGRFISQDSIEYADPESINGLNLYAYCGNNPVMNVDPTGEIFFIFSLLLAVLGGALIGGAIGAVDAVSKGDDALGGFLAGALIGGVLGGLTVLGGATALAIAGKAVSGFIAVTTFAGKTTLLATTFVGSILVSTGAGMGAYAIQETRNGREIDKSEIFRQGIMTGIKGGAAYIAGMSLATTGAYNDLLGVKLSAWDKMVRAVVSFVLQFPWRLGLK